MTDIYLRFLCAHYVQLLRPFILRRLKVDVERGMPAKTQMTVYCQLAKQQLVAYKAVLKNHVDVLNMSVSR